MLNKFKNMFKNQKGFTLVEILVVIVIIGILFTVILPRIDFASDRARQTGVKTDFKAFQTAGEGYFRESAGQGLTSAGLNTYLDEALKIPAGRTVAVAAPVAADTVLSNKEDPWGSKYKVLLSKPTTTTAQVIVTSIGKNGDATKPDFVSATYYQKGVIESCTLNFGGTQDIKLQSITGVTTCGDNIK